MKCPNCGKEIANESLFCEYCGKQIRQNSSTKLSKRKDKGWMIFSIILLVSNIIVGYLAIDYSESYHRVGSYYRQAYNEVNELNEKVNGLESELRNLRELVPKRYLTKYNNQALYDRNCYGTFIEKGCSYGEKNISVNIYTQVNGYGLTDWGWVPMNRLEEY